MHSFYRAIIVDTLVNKFDFSKHDVKIASDRQQCTRAIIISAAISEDSVQGDNVTVLYEGVSQMRAALAARCAPAGNQSNFFNIKRDMF